MNIKQILRPNLQQQAVSAGRRPQKQAASAAVQRSTDRVSWSKQALAFVEEQNRILWGKQPGGTEGSGAADPMGAELKQQYNCLKIATRIQKGDKVPLKDLKYLRDRPEGIHDGNRDAAGEASPKGMEKRARRGRSPSACRAAFGAGRGGLRKPGGLR